MTLYKQSKTHNILSDENDINKLVERLEAYPISSTKASSTKVVSKRSVAILLAIVSNLLAK